MDKQDLETVGILGDTPPFLHGYKEASKALHWPRRRLERLVESRQIRAIKPNQRTIVFVTKHLLEDVMALEVGKL